MKLHILLSLFWCVYGRPTGDSASSNGEGEEIDEPAAKKQKLDYFPEETPCYFSTVKKTPQEEQERTKFSTVSTTCAGPRMRMSDLALNQLDAQQQNMYGVDNEFELMMSRGQGLFDIEQLFPNGISDFNEKYVCESHWKELVAEWSNRFLYSHTLWVKGELHCSYPADNHRVVLKRNKAYVSAEEAEAYMTSLHSLLHVGTPVCQRHKDHLKTMKDDQQTTNEIEGTFPAELARSCSIGDPNYHCLKPAVPRDPSVVDSTISSAFHRFAEAAGFSCTRRRKNWNELSHRSKLDKAKTVKHLVALALNIVAPNHEPELRHLAFKYAEDELWTRRSSEKYDQLMNSIKSAYERAASRIEREMTLALVAGDLSLSEVHEYIPGLSKRKYLAARKTSKRGRIEVTATTTRVKYDPSKVNEFVAFLTDPTVLIGLPWGTREISLSNGDALEIPNTIRQQRNFELIHMYEKHLEQQGTPDLMMSRSTLLRILDVCAATRRKATSCVDYYVADAEDAFNDMEEILIELRDKHGLDKEEYTTLKKSLAEVRQYMRTDYRIHTMPESDVPDHCMRFALSSPSENVFALGCNHPHNRRCDRCEMLDHTLERIATFVKERSACSSITDDEKSEMDELALRHQQDSVKIYDLKRHQLRSMFANDVRAKSLQSLDENEALLTMDFAQKFIPMKHHEKQSEYFAKRGISYHITHVYANISGYRAQHSFVHVMSGEKQDTVAVTQMLEHLLHKLREAQIKKVVIKSDNAGCYHSASTLVSIPAISKRTKVEVAAYDFSESQNGKSSSDRVAAIVKKNVRIWIDKGENAWTPEQFFAVIDKTGIVGLSVYHVAVDDRAPAKHTIPQISSLYNFDYKKDTIQMWRHRDIGVGKSILVEGLPENGGSLKIIKEGGKSFAGSLFAKERMLDNHENSFWVTYDAVEKAEKGEKKKKCIGKKVTASRIVVPEDAEVADDDNREDENDNVVCDVEDANVSPGEHKEERVDESASDQQGIADDVTADSKGKPASALFSCPEPMCISTFVLEKNLKRHVDGGIHNYEPEKYTLRDFAAHAFKRGVVEENLNRRTLKVVQDAIDDVSVDKTVQGEKELALRGWALAERKPTKRFTTAQKEFLTKLYQEGEENKSMRKTPEVAEKLMSTAKNAAGKLLFASTERLLARQIAGFWGRFASEQQQKKNPDDERTTDKITSTTSLPLNDAVLEEEVNDMEDMIEEHRTTEDDDLHELIQQSFSDIFEGSSH